MFSYQTQQLLWIRFDVNNLLNILFCLLVSHFVSDFYNVHSYNKIIYDV